MALKKGYFQSIAKPPAESNQEIYSKAAQNLRRLVTPLHTRELLAVFAHNAIVDDASSKIPLNHIDHNLLDSLGVFMSEKIKQPKRRYSALGELVIKHLSLDRQQLAQGSLVPIIDEDLLTTRDD